MDEKPIIMIDFKTGDVTIFRKTRYSRYVTPSGAVYSYMRTHGIRIYRNPTPASMGRVLRVDAAINEGGE